MIFSSVLFFAFMSQVQAHDVTVHKTRASWEAAVGGGTIVTETFNSLSAGKRPVNFLVGDLEVETDKGDLYAVLDNTGSTPFDGSIYLDINLSDDEGTKVEVRPESGRVTAFGFDYFIETAATLKMQVDNDDNVGDDSDELYVLLTAGSVQFIGVTISDNGSEKIKLEGEGLPDLALSFDNVVYVFDDDEDDSSSGDGGIFAFLSK
jgi:hypothetical protein